MFLHDRQVHSIASRQAPIFKNYLLGDFNGVPIHGQDIVDNRVERIECWLNRIPSINRRIPVQNLLKGFCVGDQPLPLGDQFL